MGTCLYPYAHDWCGITYFQMTQSKTVATTETMQTTIARRSDLVLYASGTGTLISKDEVDLGFKSNGQVQIINVRVGDEVKAGDVLAIIDGSSLQVQYTQAKRNLLELTSPSAFATPQESVATAQSELAKANNQLAYLNSPAVYHWKADNNSALQLPVH